MYRYGRLTAGGWNQQRGDRLPEIAAPVFDKINEKYGTGTDTEPLLIERWVVRYWNPARLDQLSILAPQFDPVESEPQPRAELRN